MHPTACGLPRMLVAGYAALGYGWEENGLETGNCHGVEPAPKTRMQRVQPFAVHTLLGAALIPQISVHHSIRQIREHVFSTVLHLHL
jgi:hypothetical protein